MSGRPGARSWGGRRLSAAFCLVGCMGPGTSGGALVAPGDSASPVDCVPVSITGVDAWEGAEIEALEWADERGVTGVALGDLNGDGWLDAVFAGGAGAIVLLNDGAGRLTVDHPLLDDAGAVLGGAHAVALADLDADGDLDGLLGRSLASDGVLRGDGAGNLTFEPLAEPNLGITLSAELADADADGDLDAWLATGIANVSAAEVIAGTMEGQPERLYFNDGAGHFSLGELPTREVHGHTFEGRWFDAEGDGDLDVYEANDAGPFLDPNHLWLNDGAGHFARAADCGCELAMFSMGVAVGDGDNDGLPDLYISDVGGPNYLLNLGSGHFVDATEANGSLVPPDPSTMTGWGTTFLDVDGDRCQDLILMFGQSGTNTDAVAGLQQGWIDAENQPDVILRGDCEGGFERTDGWGFGDPARGRSVVVGDLDRDGQPDLVTTGKYYLKTWKLSGGCGGDVVLTLDAGPGNRQGIGARLVAEVGGRTTYQWMLPGTVSSSSAAELFVGLGGYPSADRLTVEWFEGGTTVLDDVVPGRHAVTR